MKKSKATRSEPVDLRKKPIAAGELPEVVAKQIGHTSSQMTLAHYVAPGVAEAAQLAR